MAKESWYINESELDDYQMQIVQRNLDSTFIVKGCAGSGKTVLAIWRAKELEERGEDDYLVIVFTKALKQFISDGINSIGIPSSKVLYHWEWVHRRNKQNANYIIVDEAQDFDINELNELKNAARKHFVFFGDSAQQLYSGLSDKGRLLSPQDMAYEFRVELTELVINHRLPKTIARVAEKVSNSGDPLEMRCKKEGASKPHIVECLNFEEQLDYIKDVIEAQRYTDVGILVPNNAEFGKIEKYYDGIGFDAEYKNRSDMNLNFNNTLPNVMTYHSAKGLQFETVFIPDCYVENEVNRNPLYVAITRSYREVFILHSGNLSKFISKIDDSLFELHEEMSGDSPF